MKKIFLSVPMRGRAKEDIEKSLERIKRYIRIMFENSDEEILFLNTQVKEKAPEGGNESVWYLGKSLEILSQADILVTVECPWWMNSKGVEIELIVFRNYIMRGDLQVITLPISLVITQQEYITLLTKQKLVGEHAEGIGDHDGDLDDHIISALKY